MAEKARSMLFEMGGLMMRIVLLDCYNAVFDIWADRIDQFYLFHIVHIVVLFLLSVLFVGAALDCCFLQGVSGASTWRRKHARCCLKWVV